MDNKNPSKKNTAENIRRRSLHHYMGEIYSRQNEVEDWFSWPPDIFALTSIILDTSGWYRLVVDGSGFFKDYLKKTPINNSEMDDEEDNDNGKGQNIDCWINNPNWTDDTAELGKSWLIFIELMPASIAEFKSIYESDETVKDKIAKLRAIVDKSKDKLVMHKSPNYSKLLTFVNKIFRFWGSVQSYTLNHLVEDEEILFSHKKNEHEEEKKKGKIQFIVDVIDLHSISDQISCNMGIVKYSENSRGNRDLSANSQLLMEGTLSHIDKVHGVVLPKLRLPKVGLSLRSMSQHLAFVKSEVDVIWRTMPWMNCDENTLNILVIPIPSDLKVSWFKPISAVNRSSFDSARYFEYEPDESTDKGDKIAREIVQIVQESQKKCRRVHMIVFPEMAVSIKELEKIKIQLFKELSYSQIPLIMAGVRGSEVKERPIENVNDPKPNRVVLSSFFGGRWYDLYQEKHHRWRLDRSQIENYGLSGILSGGGSWWENSTIPKRKLAFLSANGWLTMCPLICEDLARIEPVSKVIRSVGPNLVVGLLLDGPQLKSRWPARYATVLAEDPGSSVLTVTALGMCKLSNPKDTSPSRVIALWKDQTGQFEQIELKVGSSAVMLTVEATRDQEFTAHGIGDEFAAGVLALRNVHQIETIEDNESKKEDSNQSKQEDLNDVKKHIIKEYVNEFLTDKFEDKERNLKELSMFTYILNTTLFNSFENIATGVSEDIWKLYDKDRPNLVGTIFSKLLEYENSTSKEKESLNLNAVVSEIHKKIKTKDATIELDTNALIYVCCLLIGIFNEVRSEREAYIKSKKNNNAGQKIKKIKYIEKLTDKAIEYLEYINEDSAEMKKIISKINKLDYIKHIPELLKELSDLTIIRYLQAVSMSIIWSVHYHLSNSSTKNRNDISENEMVIRLEKAFDITRKPYDVHNVKLKGRKKDTKVHSI